MTSLCGVWWCYDTIFMASALIRLKKSSSRNTFSVSKDVYVCVHSHRIARSKYYGVITKKWINFNCAVVETSESTEPSNNALELNAIAYTFSKIFQPELKQFLQQSWTPCLHVFGFLSEMNKETEKKNSFSAVKDVTLFWWHTGTQKHVGRAKQDRPNRRWSKSFLGKHCQNKTSKPD